MQASQRPLQLILARNFLSSLSTPAFLVNAPGEMIFYNEAAGMLLGRRFEESGKLTPEEWTESFGPFDADGKPLAWDQLPLTLALRGNRPAHSTFHIRSLEGTRHEIEASALPIVGEAGFHGAMVVFWPVGEGPAA